MLLVTDHAGAGLVATRPGLADRLAVWCRARSLDGALAAGRSPDSGLRLALRARSIVGPRSRRHLARTLERIMDDAARPALARPVPLSAGRRRAMLAAAPDVARLVARLRAPGPVAARGVAEVLVLLGDGAGPLHLGVAEPDLSAVARTALAHLDGPLDFPDPAATGGE